MSEAKLEARPVDPVAENSQKDPVRAEEVSEKSKKKGLPFWVVLLVLLITFGAVYYAYTSATEVKPNRLPNKKASRD